MKGTLEELRADPEAVSRWLNDTLGHHGIHVALTRHDEKTAVFTVMFDAVEFTEGWYPAEVATVVVGADGDVQTLPPITDARTWEHRFPWSSLAETLRGAPIRLGKLCLWYPKDPRRLRWEWPDGVDRYLLMVQRHLLAEEYFRRHRHWPAEAAPHGSPREGDSHPILTPTLRDAS